MSVNGCLRAAADRLDTKGWNQGAYGIKDGKPCRVAWNRSPDTTCVVGAIRCSAESDNDADKAKAKLAAHLWVDNLSTWNDEPGRTREEVSAALRAVAK